MMPLDRRREEGFTLLEVLIGAGLIVIGVGAIGVTVASVRRSFKEMENRTQAMRVAAYKIDEFLGKAYSEVQEEPLVYKYDDFDYSYKVSLETASAAGGSLRIPYKKAEVVAFYTADKGKGGINSVRNVRLSNIIAYPIAHLTATSLTTPDQTALVPWVGSRKSNPFKIETGSASDGSAAVVGSGDKLLKLSDLRYNVDKTMEVTYTIALNVEDSRNKIGALDTVFTACFLDGQQHGLITRTPLLTQPSFSNKIVLSKDLVNKDTPHAIEIRWYYNANESAKRRDGKAYPADVKISLRQAGLSVLAVE